MITAKHRHDETWIMFNSSMPCISQNMMTAISKLTSVQNLKTVSEKLAGKVCETQDRENLGISVKLKNYETQIIHNSSNPKLWKSTKLYLLLTVYHISFINIIQYVSFDKVAHIIHFKRYRQNCNTLPSDNMPHQYFMCFKLLDNCKHGDKDRCCPNNDAGYTLPVVW